MSRASVLAFLREKAHGANVTEISVSTGLPCRDILASLSGLVKAGKVVVESQGPAERAVYFAPEVRG